jgi:hypothetical protein
LHPFANQDFEKTITNPPQILETRLRHGCPNDHAGFTEMSASARRTAWPSPGYLRPKNPAWHIAFAGTGQLRRELDISSMCVVARHRVGADRSERQSGKQTYRPSHSQVSSREDDWRQYDDGRLRQYFLPGQLSYNRNIEFGAPCPGGFTPPSPSIALPVIPLLRMTAPGCATMLRDAGTRRDVLKPLVDNPRTHIGRRLADHADRPDLIDQ